MKKTNILKGFATLAVVAFTSIFMTGCIPTGGVAPTPQTDSSVIYKLVNRIVVDLNNTNTNHNHVSIDLDSNGINDIDFSHFEAYGVAVTNIERVGSNELGSKNPIIITGDEFIYLQNDTIQPSHFPINIINFGSNVSSKSVFVGFRLLQTDGMHYGWMKLTMNATFSGTAPTNYPTIIKTTLVNYAYKRAPNTPIVAGKY